MGQAQDADDLPPAEQGNAGHGMQPGPGEGGQSVGPAAVLVDGQGFTALPDTTRQPLPALETVSHERREEADAGRQHALDPVGLDEVEVGVGRSRELAGVRQDRVQ